MTRTTATKKLPSARRKVDTTINVRVSAVWRDLIDNAASLLGKTRSDFIIESAQRHATDVLLEQRVFNLDEDHYAAFAAALDNPPPPNEKLKRLMAGKAPWQKA